MRLTKETILSKKKVNIKTNSKLHFAWCCFMLSVAFSLSLSLSFRISLCSNSLFPSLCLPLFSCLSLCLSGSSSVSLSFPPSLNPLSVSLPFFVTLLSSFRPSLSLPSQFFGVIISWLYITRVEDAINEYGNYMDGLLNSSDGERETKSHGRVTKWFKCMPDIDWWSSSSQHVEDTDVAAAQMSGWAAAPPQAPPLEELLFWRHFFCPPADKAAPLQPNTDKSVMNVGGKTLSVWTAVCLNVLVRT